MIQYVDLYDRTYESMCDTNMIKLGIKRYDELYDKFMVKLMIKHDANHDDKQMIHL